MNKQLGIVAAAAVALLAGLYVAFKPEPAAAPERADASAAQQPAAGVPLRQEFMLLVEGGKLVAGPERMTVQQGTDVTLRITSDKADELHLHGYDRSVKLTAREPAVLAFLADRAGHFELELHDSHAELGAIEVQPAN
jgi:hypothetical protein